MRIVGVAVPPTSSLMRHAPARLARLFAATAWISVAMPHGLPAQNTRYVISIGDHPDVVGLRINFRDRDLQRVDGVNLTLWSPYEPFSGTIRGMALGLPVTGAQTITGVATGVFGVGVSREMTGIAAAPLGFGSGGRVVGVGIGGLGIGAGGDVKGAMVGGLGVGAGGSVRGLMVGGIGVGAGGGAEGILVGGVGVGAGGDVTGGMVGGVGVGAGGNMRGYGVGGVGVGVGGNATGLFIGGVGVGAGGLLKGIAIGGIGVGASALEGFATGGVGVGAGRARAFVITPGMLRIERDGRFSGVSINGVGSMIKGDQHGVTIGLVNYTRVLTRGFQVGLINIVSEAQAHRFMPIINWPD